MSCFAKIKSPLNGKTVTSPAYYQLTSFFPADQGKKIYAATTTNTFKQEFGFDWTKPQAGYSPKLNFVGEPTIEHINAHLRLGMTETEIRAAQQIEEVAALGYLNVGYKNPNAFDTIVNEINLNPKYNLIDSEVLVRDGKHYLSVKPVTGVKVQKPISKAYLKSLKFPDMVLNNIADFNNATLTELLENLLNNKELAPFQQKMIQRLLNLMRINPTLKVTVFDDADVDQEFQRSFYDPKSNTIYIGKTISSDFNNQRFAQELIHEAVHAYTISALTNPRTEEEIKFRQDLEKYIGEYRRRFPRLQRHYGFKNVEEFVSEYLSNPYFREDLQQAEKTSKDKTFIERIIGEVKRFLRNVLGIGTLADKVNETIEDYFDYLENLEDMPDLAGEHELRFNAPYNTAPPVSPDSPNLQRFKQYIDATFKSTAWKQINQSLSEIDPRFNSIDRIREKFGNLSTLSLGSAIKSSIDYLKEIDKVLNRLEKDVALHRDNLGYYSSEDAVAAFNHAMNVADFLKDQIEQFKATLLPELQLELTKTDLEADPLARARFLQQRQISIENFQKTSEEVTELINRIDTKSKNLKDQAKEAILAPVASQLSEPFKLVAEKLQAPDSDLNKEIALKEQMLARAIASNQPKQAADLQKDLQQLNMLKSWVPTRANILKLLQSGIDPQHEYAGTHFLTVYLGVANTVGSPIVQTVKQYLDVHIIEAENVSREFTRRAEKLRERVTERNKKNGIGLLPTSFARMYQGFTREVDMVYYDDQSGVRKVIKQLAYNTRFKEAEFRNDLQELERAVEIAIKNGVESEIQTAEQNLQRFLENYAVRPYTDEYYEAEELLSDDARAARQEILKELEEHQAVFGDAELTAEERQERAELRRQYERLGSIYNEDGSEKPKGSKERAIADSIIAYKNKRKALDAVEFVIPEKVRLRFQIERDQRINKVNQLSRKISLLKTQINDGLALGEDVSEFEKELVDTQFALGEAEAERDRWLNANTRTEISPEFFEAQRDLAEQIREIFVKYGQDPLLSEAYDELFNSVKGYRDEDGVIVGTSFKRGLAQTVKSIEERIEALKEQAENSRQISEEDKKILKDLFNKLNNLQSKETTIYYNQEIKRISEQIASQMITEKDTMDEIDRLAEQYADEYIESSGLTELIELDDQLPELRSPSEFGTDKHRAELIIAFKNRLTEKEIQTRLKQSDWYKSNHVTITKSYVDKRTGEKITRVSNRPIYIWNRTIPRNRGYILQNNPNFDWAVPRVREEYKNKDHNFLGKARPRKTADNRYLNPEYDKLTDEERGIVDDMVALYEDEQRFLPKSQRLEGYTVPNIVRDDKEDIVMSYVTPYARFKSLFDSFKLFFSSGKPGEGQDESNVLDDTTNKKLVSQGRKVQLIKTRYKEPLNVNQVSHELLRGLASFGVYTSEFAGLKKAMPAIFAARDIAQEKFPPNDIKMIDEEIQRFFYGEEVKTSMFGSESPIAKGVMRVMNRIFRFSQKRVLMFNVLRLFKNVFTNFLRIVLKKNRYGFTRKELLKAWWKGLRKRSDLLQLELGSKQYSDYALKLIHFRAVPAANPTQLANNINQTAMYKFFNFENFNSQVFGYTEMASTIPIYEAFMARTTVPITINGQTVNIKLDEAYEIVDGILVPKDGVFGLQLNEVRNLVDQRKQVIANYLLQKGVSKIEQLSSADRVELKNLVTPIDIKISAIEAQNKPKLEKLKLVEQYVRDNIHEMYTLTQGNYFSRSRSSYEKRLWANMLMSMRRWLFPSLQNQYGERRLAMYTGRIDEGFYRGGARSLIRKLKYLSSGERINMGYTELEKKNHATVGWDTVNALGLHAISLGLSTLLLSSLAGGGDDDDNLLLGILAIISLGTYDEYISTHPILGPSNWLYKTFFRKPLEKPGDEQGAATLTVKYGLHMLTGASLRSFDQIGDVLSDTRNFTDPFEPYYVQRREQGGISDFYTRKTTEGVPRVLASAMKLYGIESGLEPFSDPTRRLQDMLKLNPMLGQKDPLGDYVQIQAQLRDVKKEIFARDIDDIKKFESGDWTGMSSPDTKKQVELILKYDALNTLKVQMEMNNKYIRKALEEKEQSSYEGNQESDRLDKNIELLTGRTKAKRPKSVESEINKLKEKTWNELRFQQTFPPPAEDTTAPNMNFD